jgi:hypothetical protein
MQSSNMAFIQAGVLAMDLFLITRYLFNQQCKRLAFDGISVFYLVFIFLFFHPLFRFSSGILL